MRWLVIAAVAVGFALAAAPAQAVTYDYCTKSLMGGGSLAPDDDIKREWNRLEGNGYDITAAFPVGWHGGDGAVTVWEDWHFSRGNGGRFLITFVCSKAGGSYYDGRDF